MYPHQAERLTQSMDRGDVHALVASSPENVRYVSGFASVSQAVYRDAGVLAVATRTEVALVVPAIDAPTVAADGGDTGPVVCYGRFHVQNEGRGPDATRLREWMAHLQPTLGDALREALDVLGVKTGRVGLDETGLSPAAHQALRSMAPVHVVPAADLFTSARMIKGPYEIDCLHRATRIAEEAANVVIQMLAPGVTERDAVAVYEAEVMKRGAQPACSLILVGERSALPAAYPTTRPLRARDLVRFELGCAVNGYRADLARTAVLGEPAAPHAAAFESLLAGLEAGLDALRPGARAGDVFMKTVEAVRGRGLDYHRHHVGHGIGLEPREPPTLAADDDTPLHSGMVLRVETPYYDYGRAGINVKETALVTNSGAHVLNRSHRGLIILD